jgi:hypothetical protein
MWNECFIWCTTTAAAGLAFSLSYILAAHSSKVEGVCCDIPVCDDFFDPPTKYQNDFSDL